MNLTPWYVFLILKSQLTFLSLCYLIWKSGRWVTHQRWSYLQAKSSKIISLRRLLCSKKCHFPKTLADEIVLILSSWHLNFWDRKNFLLFTWGRLGDEIRFSSASPSLMLSQYKEKQGWIASSKQTGHLRRLNVHVQLKCNDFSFSENYFTESWSIECKL